MRRRTWWLLLIGLALGGAAAWYVFKPLTEKPIGPAGTPTPTVFVTTEPTATSSPTPTLQTLSDQPFAEGASYFERTPAINGQQNYLMYPLHVDPQNPPVLIIYSHGSNTTVTTNFSDQAMKDMRAYGEYFASRGYGFMASAEHGANWGSTAAVQDMLNSLNWVKARYPVSPKAYLVAHSMGGLPSFNFAFKYPTAVGAMAMLAPTTRPESWTASDYKKLRNIPIKIWHGDADVNVPWSLSNQTVQAAKKAGLTIEFETLKGKGHFDVDTELKSEIFTWFEEKTAAN